jgi:hypothetical protein
MPVQTRPRQAAGLAAPTRDDPHATVTITRPAPARPHAPRSACSQKRTTSPLRGRGGLETERFSISPNRTHAVRHPPTADDHPGATRPGITATNLLTLVTATAQAAPATAPRHLRTPCHAGAPDPAPMEDGCWPPAGWRPAAAASAHGRIPGMRPTSSGGSVASSSAASATRPAPRSARRAAPPPARARRPGAYRPVRPAAPARARRTGWPGWRPSPPAGPDRPRRGGRARRRHRAAAARPTDRGAAVRRGDRDRRRQRGHAGRADQHHPAARSQGVERGGELAPRATKARPATVTPCE